MCLQCDNYTKNVADNLKITYKDLKNAATVNTDSDEKGKKVLFLLLILPIINMYMNVVLRSN